MKKELVAYIDLYGYWTCVYNVLLTEGKKITTPESVIEIIKKNYPHLSAGNFVIKENEIFVEIVELDITVNYSGSINT